MRADFSVKLDYMYQVKCFMSKNNVFLFSNVQKNINYIYLADSITVIMSNVLARNVTRNNWVIVIYYKY